MKINKTVEKELSMQKNQLLKYRKYTEELKSPLRISKIIVYIMQN